MLEKSLSLTIIILLFAITVNAQSRRPIPSRGIISKPIQDHSGSKQQPAEPDKRGTEQSPFVVKTVNPPKTQAEADQERRDREEKAANDRHLVWFTGALALVAIFQFLALLLQAVYLYKGFQAANISAKAAIDSTDKSQRSIELSEKQMVISQRAFVFIKGIHPHSFNLPKWKIISSEWASIMPKKVVIIPEWQNIGNTPTKNMRTHDNWMFFPLHLFPTGMPDDFNFPDLGTIEDTPVLIGPKATIFGRDLVINDPLIDAVMTNRGQLYIWGWAEYNDIFENTPRHRTEFCNKVIINWIDADHLRVEFRIHTKHNGADEQCLKKPIT